MTAVPDTPLPPDAQARAAFLPAEVAALRVTVTDHGRRLVMLEEQAEEGREDRAELRQAVTRLHADQRTAAQTGVQVAAAVGAMVRMSAAGFVALGAILLTQVLDAGGLLWLGGLLGLPLDKVPAPLAKFVLFAGVVGFGARVLWGPLKTGLFKAAGVPEQS